MAEQRDELLDHEYDGIKEYNNPLPRWWLWLFYGTILFAAFYLPWHWLGYGLSGPQEYQEELAAVQRAPAAPAPGGAPPGPGQPDAGKSSRPQGALAPAAVTPAMVEEGKAIFAANCVPCHGPQGQGIIGPNLTDNHWMHGNTLGDITRTITDGVPDKGMIAWKTVLNPQKIAQVAAYVKSLKGTNPPNPKPPQGQLYKD